MVGSEKGHLILKHLKLLDLSSNPIKVTPSLFVDINLFFRQKKRFSLQRACRHFNGS